MTTSRLRSIVATSDLGEGSDISLRTAAALAEGTGADLHVFHCVTQPVFPYWEGTVDPATRERWRQSAGQDLEWQVRRVLGDEAAPRSLEVTIGEPAREINAFAGGATADLIVLGPHRPRGAFDSLLGTTADRVIRTATVPCLIANRPITLPVQRVLLPTDFSGPAQHALSVGMDLLVSLAEQAEGSATVVEVLYVSVFASPSARPFAVEPQLAKQVDAARQRIPPGVRMKILPRILSAPLPVEGIFRVAEQVDAELIILGTHGYGTLGRTLIGSVASSVVRTVPFPILLVPPHG